MCFVLLCSEWPSLHVCITSRQTFQPAVWRNRNQTTITSLRADCSQTRSAKFKRALFCFASTSPFITLHLGCCNIHDFPKHTFRVLTECWRGTHRNRDHIHLAEPWLCFHPITHRPLGHVKWAMMDHSYWQLADRQQLVTADGRQQMATGRRVTSNWCLMTDIRLAKIPYLLAKQHLAITFPISAW